MNKKIYIAVKAVIDFIDKQPIECQAEYLKLVEKLEDDGYLIEPYAKKIERNLFEIRIRRGRQVRVFYCYNDGNYVIGVHAFVKKSQKTPLKEIKQARRVVKQL